MQEATYAAALHAALANPEIAPTLDKWLTATCPECGDLAASGDGLHIMVNGFVAVGCEGYAVVNPNAVGIDDPDWHDWQ